MPLINIFRKRKSEKKPEKKEIREKKEGIEEKPSVPAPEVKAKKGKGRIISQAPLILKSPQITEKATDLVKKNQYVFKVQERANKTEIKKAIENLYGVNATSVRIIKIPQKPRRLGKQRGYKSGYKKAIVKIKEGQKIEVLPR